MYYTYMIRVEGGALYTGITKNMFSRMAQHSSRGKESAKYTRSHKILSLEGLWSSADRASASRLEYALKTLKKGEKEALLSDHRLLSFFLPRIEKEDYIYHPMANLDLFLKKTNLKHLL